MVARTENMTIEILQKWRDEDMCTTQIILERLISKLQSHLIRWDVL